MTDQSTRDLSQHTTETLFQQMQRSDWFGEVLAQIKTLQSLQALFDQECPLELMGRCRVLGIKNACLTIEVDNASWASQLQYRTRELRVALCRYPEFMGLKKIVVRISRVALPSNVIQPSLPFSPISSETAKMLDRVAQEVADPVLKQALQNFAQSTPRSP